MLKICRFQKLVVTLQNISVRVSDGHSKSEHIEIIAIDEVVQENKGRGPGASRSTDEVSVKFDQRLDSRLSAGKQ